MEILDWFFVAIYFVLVMAIALYAYYKTRQSSEKESHAYFLAGRHSTWVVIGASLFASNIGSEHLIGLAGTGAANGVAVAQFEILASLCLLLLGWFFAPIYLKMGIVTMPEFLERKFGSGARWYLAVVSIISYVMTKISVTIAAGALVLEQIIGISFWSGALILVVLTGFYTVLGGLRAVMYTDFFQAIVLVFGAIVITVLGIEAVGGVNPLLSYGDTFFWSVWQPSNNPDFPWTGILFGAPILGIWYWCTDQFIVQRVLSAKNLAEAQKGCVFAAALKLMPLFIFVIPGIIAAVLASQGKLTLDTADHALPQLMSFLLPAGLKGLVVAGMLSALMSSLSSVFNSCSTLITFDIFKRLRPSLSERQLVKIGRWSTGGLVIAGILWIPLMERISGQIYQYLQSVQAYIAPPITAVFLCALFVPLMNSKGALTALWSGFAIGMTRLILEVSFGADYFEGILQLFVSINFLHFAALLFVFSGSLGLLVSYFTRIERVTATTINSEKQSLGQGASYSGPLIIIFLVAIIWVVFSKWGLAG